MDEHVRHVHATSAEMEDQPGAGNPSLDDGSSVAETQPPGADREDAAPQPLEELDRTLLSGVDMGGPLGGPGDELHSSPSHTESSLTSSPQPTMAPQVEPVDRDAVANPPVIDGEQPSDPVVALRQYASPSPTPSEQDSASRVTNTATNNDTRPPSPVSSESVSPDSFSDPSTRSTPSSSTSNSVVFVSADGIPDYIRENRAILVATSAGSPSSGRTPLRLPSSSSLESLDVTESQIDERGSTLDAAATGHGVTLRLHCRICRRDPCEDMTATICGHVFCKRCITQAVVAKSECPVCKSATLLYCLFKLDLSV
ncbi:hypothetical protein OG21DRAFT_1210476 [Imleria badia]|nr:hypothetical protein OG21DRAFT_1210476 [Imleria badia]